MLLDIVTKGSTDRSVTIKIIDATDGTPETGVVFNTTGIDLWYRREGGSVVSITEATQTIAGAHADGGFIHLGNGNYRLDLPDAAFATGANYVDVGGTVTGMIVIGGRVRLANVDLEDVVRAGLTALPNAAADAAGGLPISDAGGLDLDARIGTDIPAILVDTAVIGAAGAGLTEAGGTGDHLTAIAWNAAWDAEVQSEVTDALNAYDPPTNAEMEARTLAAAAYFDPTTDTVDVGSISGSATAAATLEAQMDAYVEGTAQGGAAGSITLASGASATNDYYNGQAVWITGGTGAGQFRIIDDYVGSTKVASVSPNWATNPDATSVYVLAGAPASTASPPAVNVTQVAGTAQTAGDLGADVAAILVDTGTTLPATLTTIDNEIAVIDGIVDSILVDTAEIGAAGAGLTAVPWNASWDAEVQSEVQDAIEANHLDHLLAADYDPASKPGVATALLNEMVENDAGVSRFTVNALENGPSGSGASAEAIADAVWDELLSGHTTTGSAGAELSTAADASGLDAAGVRAAVGLASPNLDTQLGAIDTVVDAVLVDTGTTLPASLATIDANVDAVLVDTGTSIPALIAALNDPSATAIRDAILDRVLATNHDTAGSVGAVLQAILADTGTTLDAKLDAIDTVVDAILVDTGTTLDAKVDVIDGIVDAIRAKTDSLTFTQTGHVDANVQRINDVAITGDGSATPFGV